MKKIFTLLFVLTASVSMLFAEAVQIGDLFYKLNSATQTAAVTASNATPNYDGLDSIVIPSTVEYGSVTYTVTAIDTTAFNEANTITYVSISGTVQTICDMAFHSCNELEELIIADGVTTLEPFAICSNPKLRTLHIPASVTSIGRAAVMGNNGLESLIVDAANSVYDSRDNCNAIIETASNTLISGCRATTIPSSVTALGYGAFRGVETNSVIIPEGVTTIGEDCFYYGDIQRVVIPRSVTAIGETAFECSFGRSSWKTYEIYVYWDTPLAINANVFDSSYASRSRVTLYVPAGTKALYEAADGWKKFGNIVEMASPTAWEDGVLPGMFSISDSTKVFFSQGNLQYQASTNIWRFAEHQYDTIGILNSNISPSYDGWIDLFGWGTGSNPTQTSTNNADYPSFTDWGINPISNGGNVANAWRTLSEQEFRYLYEERTDAASLRGVATVCGMRGYVFLPDNWQDPAGLDFQANSNNWRTNVYSAGQWNAMENAGAVFLPAAGYREGAEADLVNEYGIYWLASSYNANNAYRFIYYDSYRSIDYNYRYLGNSVRLVQDLPCVNKRSEISVTAFDSYTWNGERYTASGDYYQTFTMAGGCDSIVGLHLTINGGYCGAESPNGENLQWNYDPDTYDLIITGTGEMRDYDDPYDVPWYGFVKRHKIDSVSLPDGLTSIGGRALYSCDATHGLVLPSSVTRIGYAALHSASFYSITLPDNLTTIGPWALADMANVTSILIPARVDSIGEKALLYANKKTSIIVDENNAKYDSRNNCNAVIETATDKLLFACPTTVIPNTVAALGGFAFYNLLIDSIAIPEGVTAIEGECFGWCTRLRYLSIPQSVQTIGEMCFSRMAQNITGQPIDVYVYWDTPLAVPASLRIFYGADLASFTLHVPAGTKTLYEAADVWRDFGTIVEMPVSAYLTVDQVLAESEVTALASGETTASTFTVRGYVTKIQENWRTSNKNMSFWIDDVDCGSQTKFEIFRAGNADETPAKVGDFVECVGQVNYYQGKTYEMPQGSTYTIITAGADGQEMGAATIADFIAAASCRDTYTLTGTVSNITNTTYGNFDLTDATGTVYIYGLLTADGVSKQFASMDIDEGDEVTLKAIYGVFNGDVQVSNAIFVSRTKHDTTGLEPIGSGESRADSRKILRNGQLLIIRDGRTYNAFGIEIK